MRSSSSAATPYATVNTSPDDHQVSTRYDDKQGKLSSSHQHTTRTDDSERVPLLITKGNSVSDSSHATTPGSSWFVRFINKSFTLLLYVTYLVTMGAVFVLIKKATEQWPPVESIFSMFSLCSVAITMAAMRTGSAGATMLIISTTYAIVSPKYFRPIFLAAVTSFSVIWKVWVLAWTNSLLPSLLLMTSESMGLNAGATSIIMASAPIFAIFLSAIFVRGSERLTIYKIIVSICAMCGVILVILHDLINADANVGAVPYLLVVIAALCFGISPVFSRLCVKDIHPLMVVTGQVAFAGLQGWVVSLIFDYNWPPKHFARHYGFFAEIDYVGWIMAFSLGATSCIGFSIFFLLIPRIGAAMTATTNYFTPCVAIVGGVLFLNAWEGYTLLYKLLEMLGCLIVASCVIILSIENMKLRKAEEQARAEKKKLEAV